MTALEILRRFQWIFFRVESEWNKLTRANSPMSSKDSPKEMERLIEHGVWSNHMTFLAITLITTNHLTMGSWWYQHVTKQNFRSYEVGLPIQFLKGCNNHTLHNPAHFHIQYFFI